MANAPIRKVAVDEKAKSYWEKYYKEYGRDWVRDVPRRIRAELANRVYEGGEPLSRTAATESPAEIFPINHVRQGEKFIWEGMYRCDGENLLFRADFDGKGEITDITPVAVPV